MKILNIKKLKGQRSVFKNYTDYSLNDKTILKLQQKFKSDLQQAVTMIRDYQHLIKLQHIHTEQTHLKHGKVKC